MLRHTGVHAPVSRRAFMASTVSAAALLVPRPSIASSGSQLPDLRAQAQDESATPGDWRMWYLASADAIRPPAPGAATQDEVDEVIRVQSAAVPEVTEAIMRWGTGPAPIAWSNLAIELFAEFGMGAGIPQSRPMAILHTTMHDAAIAAWDAQVAHARPGPAATDSSITPAGGVDAGQPSFPSAHAAVAGAASVVLSHLFTDAAEGRFDQLAAEAAESRIAAGAAFPSDIDAGLEIGHAVAELAIARAMDDGSAQTWDPATMPSGPGVWKPTPPMFVDAPAFPLGGSRTPWVLTGGDQFRPAPPPEHGSAAWRSELAQVRHIVANRDFEQDRAAVWWGTSSPIVHFTKWAQEHMTRTGATLPEAARILADLHVAIDDTLIGIWDAKYTYWTSRPITDDEEIVTSVPTPPYPAYPAGYPAAMSAGATVMGHYFPDVSVDMDQRAWEASCSRLWAGIHYGIDNDAGLLLGRRVGRLVAALDSA